MKALRQVVRGLAAAGVTTGALLHPASAEAAAAASAQAEATGSVAAKAQVEATGSAAASSQEKGVGSAQVKAGGSAGVQGGQVMSLPSLVAYVRNGDIYVSKGASEKRLTTGGTHARPRWAPDGKSLAYLKGGYLWVMRADGTGQRRLTTRAAGGPSWSPDGKWIAFASLSCSGGPGVYRISATAGAATAGGTTAGAATAGAATAGAATAGAATAGGTTAGAATAGAAAAGAAVAGAATAGAAAAGTATAPEILFPRDCRGEELPPEPAPVTARAGSLSERLRTDDAVAWSPDGTRVAFRGGDCESVYDACLSVGTVATGGEQTVAAYGGGSLQTSGFAVVPSWRADGAKLAWTAYQKGETKADDQPVHLVEYDTKTRVKRNVGGALDREIAYLGTSRAVVTGQVKAGSWIVIVDLARGTRAPFHEGSQPSVQPVR
ncbi:hypothetical protein [Actinoplanes sp. URMC 104]|uniref:hypothetical protein n=1 Tax=Actinoplanes sp. URMC 104 TaxID=3423409 RepID=UPI003F1AABD1